MSVASTQRKTHGERKIFALNESNPLVPWLFMLPHAVLFLVFIVYPIVSGLWISVHNFSPVNTEQPFVGLEYYRNLFDPSTIQFERFWQSMKNTLFFVVVSVPLLVVLPLTLAILLQKPIFGRDFFRAIFFLPGILSGTVVAVLWRWMFDNQSGLINAILQQYLGLQPIPFLTTEGLAWIPIIAATLWASMGFNMTVYLAALTGISPSLYEAAEIDGAGTWAQFRFITFPMLAPTHLFVVVTSVLGSFGLFYQSQFITQGGPVRSTMGVIQYITEEAFTNNNYSSATAISFMFALVMLTFTVVQFRLMVRDLKGKR